MMKIIFFCKILELHNTRNSIFTGRRKDTHAFSALSLLNISKWALELVQELFFLSEKKLF